MKQDSEAIFWERVADMPAWEAEQELVLRRESVVLENAMLMSERERLSNGRESRAISAAIAENNAQLTAIGERIKYLRKLQDKVQWKKAVIDLFGQEAFEQCVVYMEQQYGEKCDQRREWNGSPRNTARAA